MKPMIARFLQHFGALLGDDAGKRAVSGYMVKGVTFKSMEKGEVLLREGDFCDAVPFVLEGSIRVFRTSSSGKEITLYRIKEGQSCILGSSCAAGNPRFPARAVVDEAGSAAFLSRSIVRRLIDTNPVYRTWVLDQYARRISEIIDLVDEVAFSHIDKRLAEYLVSRAGPDMTLHITHQELAGHLGTSREVVSRILKDWKAKELLVLSRGRVRLLRDFGRLFESRGSSEFSDKQ